MDIVNTYLKQNLVIYKNVVIDKGIITSLKRVIDGKQ